MRTPADLEPIRRLALETRIRTALQAHSDWLAFEKPELVKACGRSLGVKITPEQAERYLRFGSLL